MKIIYPDSAISNQWGYNASDGLHRQFIFSELITIEHISQPRAPCVIYEMRDEKSNILIYRRQICTANERFIKEGKPITLCWKEHIFSIFIPATRIALNKDFSISCSIEILSGNATFEVRSFRNKKNLLYFELLYLSDGRQALFTVYIVDYKTPLRIHIQVTEKNNRQSRIDEVLFYPPEEDN